MIQSILEQLFPVTTNKRQQLRQNYAILRREVDRLGKEYEQKSYEELLDPAESTEIIRIVDNQKLNFSAEVYHLKKDGTLCFSLDADGLPTMFGIKPSYHFYKRPDNSIFY